MMEFLLRPVMNTSSWAPALIASATAYWISGLSTIGSISFALAFVAGRKRVPRPATGKTALRIRNVRSLFCPRAVPQNFPRGASLAQQASDQMNLVGVARQQAEIDACSDGVVLQRDAARQEQGLLERAVEPPRRGAQMRLEDRRAARQRPHAVCDRLGIPEQSRGERIQMDRIHVAGDAAVATADVLRRVEAFVVVQRVVALGDRLLARRLLRFLLRTMKHRRRALPELFVADGERRDDVELEALVAVLAALALDADVHGERLVRFQWPLLLDLVAQVHEPDQRDRESGLIEQMHLDRRGDHLRERDRQRFAGGEPADLAIRVELRRIDAQLRQRRRQGRDRDCAFGLARERERRLEIVGAGGRHLLERESRHGYGTCSEITTSTFCGEAPRDTTTCPCRSPGCAIGEPSAPRRAVTIQRSKPESFNAGAIAIESSSVSST